MPKYYSLTTTIISIFSISVLSSTLTLALSTCQSCYYGCPDMNSCECVNSNDTCQSEYCFVKIQRIDAESEVSTVFKGCADKVAPSELLGGCRYGGDQWSVECYCKGHMCNSAKLLNLYQPQAQPMVQCCACDPYNEEEDIGCMPTSCFRFCRGHYCYVDMGRQTQGCGYGFPWEYTGMRTSSVEPYNDQKFSCSISVADSPNLDSWSHRCTCVEDQCNIIQDAYEYDLNVTQRVDVAQMYCHSVYNVSREPVTIDAYEKSNYCEGHYCYVQAKTTVVINGNSLEKRYELSAGCLLSDNDTKVEVGCTTEWSADSETPYFKRCICSNDYCNLLTMITGEPRKQWLVMLPVKRASSISTRFSFIMLNLLLLIFIGF